MSGRGSFFQSERIQCPTFCISRSKVGRFYNFLPLLGGGQEGILENLKRPHLHPPLRGEENLGHPCETKAALRIHPKRGRKLVKGVESMTHRAKKENNEY